MRLVQQAGTYSYSFPLEHAERVREARTLRVAASLRAAKPERLASAGPRLIPRIAGALGLF